MTRAGLTRRRYWLTLSIAVVLGIPLLCQAAEYQIDPNTTSIQFRIRHLTIFNITGTFKKFSASATINDWDPSALKVRVTVDAASIDTGLEERDEYLRGHNFFDVAKYPTIHFISRKVDKVSPDKLKITGDLSMHGVTREVVIDVERPTIAIKDPRGDFKRKELATTKINRSDFGLTWNKLLDTGGMVIGEEVNIQADVEWIRK
jgi:polyisoprenoid-binding protein YceI